MSNLRFFVVLAAVFAAVSVLSSIAGHWLVDRTTSVRCVPSSACAITHEGSRTVVVVRGLGRG